MVHSGMSSTHTSLHYHIVFSTKNREPHFGSDVRTRLHEYLGGIVRGLDGVANQVGGVADHVHLAVGLNQTHRLCDVMRELKANSSSWVKTELGIKQFQWQEGYGAFTFGAPDLDRVAGYIRTQENHHRVTTFQEEYVAMLARGLVEYKEE